MGSPPLEERSWIPTPKEVSWKPRPEKVNLFSATLERISSSPAKMTLVSPISLKIPNTSSGMTREDEDMSPMDLTCRRKPLEEMLRDCLMRTSPPKSTPGWSSHREPSTCPPLSGDSFMNLPVNEIVNSLQPPQPPERATPTVRDSRSSVIKDVMLNTPVNNAVQSSTSTDNGRSGLMTSVPTRTSLWSPAENLKWPLSPPMTGNPMTSSLGGPGQLVKLVSTKSGHLRCHRQPQLNQQELSEWQNGWKILKFREEEKVGSTVLSRIQS